MGAQPLPRKLAALTLTIGEGAFHGHDRTGTDQTSHEADGRHARPPLLCAGVARSADSLLRTPICRAASSSRAQYSKACRSASFPCGRSAVRTNDAREDGARSAPANARDAVIAARNDLRSLMAALPGQLTKAAIARCRWSCRVCLRGWRTASQISWKRGSSMGRPFGKFRPDQVPVVRPQIAPRHCAVSGALDCSAALNWNRPDTTNPLAHGLRGNTAYAREGRLSANSICRPFHRGLWLHSNLRKLYFLRY